MNLVCDKKNDDSYRHSFVLYSYVTITKVVQMIVWRFLIPHW